MFDVTDWIEHGSYAGLFIAMVLTGIGLPVPEEAFVILAGVFSHQGVLRTPLLAWAACLSGALIGDLATYGLGRHFGHNVIREHPIIAKHLTPDRERHLEMLIRRHGIKVFIVSRFLVGVRSSVYLTAGILRVPLTWFLIVDSVCATTVVSLFFGLSYFFADRIQAWWHLIRQAEIALTIGLVLSIVAIGGYLWWRRRNQCLSIAELLDRALGVSKNDNDPNTPAPPPVHETQSV